MSASLTLTLIEAVLVLSACNLKASLLWMKFARQRDCGVARADQLLGALTRACFTSAAHRTLMALMVEAACGEPRAHNRRLEHAGF
jgi:hypothetical protein